MPSDSGGLCGVRGALMAPLRAASNPRDLPRPGPGWGRRKEAGRRRNSLRAAGNYRAYQSTLLLLGGWMGSHSCSSGKFLEKDLPERHA